MTRAYKQFIKLDEK